MKHVILFAILFFIGVHSIAQLEKDKISIGVGLSVAIPVYNLAISSVGGGADALLQYGLSKKLSITADAAFIALPGKDNYPSTAIIPIRLGLRYFPASKIYLGVKTGLGIYTILKASANHFAYAVSSGYFITKKLNTGLFYDGYSNKNSSFGYLGIRTAYQF